MLQFFGGKNNDCDFLLNLKFKCEISKIIFWDNAYYSPLQLRMVISKRHNAMVAEFINNLYKLS